jgi:formylmethanofuran dehydrogenase subunit E
MNKEIKYPKEIHCSGCDKVTPHIPKLSAVLDGKLVCDVCRKMNPYKKDE